jgi:hypothetical protein
MSVNILLSLYDATENIYEQIFVIPKQQICHVTINIFQKCEACIRSQHSEILL